MKSKKEITLVEKDLPQELLAIKPIIPQILGLVRDGLGQTTTFETKSDETTSTGTDVSLDKTITSAIKTHFPTDTILSEELSPDANRSANRLWVIDPLCGSFNFAVGIPLAATNIALFENQRLAFSIVIDHLTQHYYWAAEKFEGIFQEETRVKVLDHPEGKYVINVDLGNLQNKGVPDREPRIAAFARIVHDLILEGYEPVNLYTSLSATYTALGLRAATLIPSTNPWDEAAACYLIEKNGGKATDFSGKPPDPSMTSAVGSLDPTLHSYLLSFISRHWPG